ncbi:BCS1 N terminal-domain-containing protein [Polychytrium aggregatum]|uniref:BCS1 N terminal-domain-containing protein n=1 Tax=Polychytrium aggregatum TaxID=110093 RepID=UPI0022FECF7E|nr:BCS1 N terminal-domain-containing protein [Polychytrium aggregatum]KAI9204308.1 BCS1 N terminal-domain-containing protein [Polychytrium aggregatum]
MSTIGPAQSEAIQKTIVSPDSVAPGIVEPALKSIGHFTKALADQVGISGNEIATGGLTLAVLGAGLAGARILGDILFEMAKKQFMVTAEFASNDESYSWILGYLSDHPVSKRTTRFTVTSSVSKTGADADAVATAQAPQSEGSGFSILPRVYFLPSPGIHFFFYEGRLVWLERHRPKGHGGSEILPERITLTTFGRSRELLHRLVLEAQRQHVEKDHCRTVIYSADQWGNWRRTRSRPIRPMNSIILDGDVKQKVARDMVEFLRSEKWYADRGIPYRRGYMLYGSPGTGKTSFVTALAGEVKLNIYVISLANKGLSDETLTELMVDTPPRCILLLEDIDAAFVSRESAAAVAPGASTAAAGTASANVTFSGLLNAIDGVAAQEGRLLFMTTNHIEKLDPALIRPGRVDVKVLLDLATSSQAQGLFDQFYPHDETSSEIMELSIEFARGIPDRTYSMAQLQGYLMRYKNNPQLAVQNVGELIRGGAQVLRSD